VHAKLRGKFAARRNALARPQISAMHKRANLVAQLHVEWNVAFALQMKWNHWLTQLGQFIVTYLAVKSQFVFLHLVRQASACLLLISSFATQVQSRQAEGCPTKFAQTWVLRSKLHIAFINSHAQTWEELN